MSAAISDQFTLRRQRLVHRLFDAGIHNERVLNAIMSVPRQFFVEEALSHRAYDNVALPIGLGQTISQPYIVARMSELLIGDKKPRRVLEIGTGCGYQTAVLAALSIPVIYSIERLSALSQQASRNLKKIPCSASISLSCGDGYAGLPHKAPFDGIIVTAAAARVPPALIDQLGVGGRLVLPLGEGKKQFLWMIERQEQGFMETCLEEVCFVPLVNGKV